MCIHMIYPVFLRGGGREGRGEGGERAGREGVSVFIYDISGVPKGGREGGREREQGGREGVCIYMIYM